MNSEMRNGWRKEWAAPDASRVARFPQYAASMGREEAVALLLAHGADPKTTSFNNTALHAAAGLLPRLLVIYLCLKKTGTAMKYF